MKRDPHACRRLILMALIASVVLLLLQIPIFGASESEVEETRGEEYGLELKKVPHIMCKCNPVDESEVEFKFILINTGNQNDTYTVEVETPLGSGTYKDWTIEFENDRGERVDQLSVPSDLPGSTEDELGPNERVDITLYVTVALDEEEGIYEDISISATSDNDNSQVMYLYFNLTVILPNIRLSNDPSDFYIDPDRGIEEDDSIDIHLRVFNDGDAETDKFYVLFYNGKKDDINENPGNWIAYERIENIPANSFKDILVYWEDIEGGQNDLYAKADKPIRSGVGATKNSKGTFLEDGLVLESKENDNAVSIDDLFQEAVDLRPDLTITNIDWDDNKVDTTTIVTVSIANVGSAKAEIGSATVSLKIGGDTMKSKDNEIINPTLPEDIDVGDEIDIEFTWKIEEEDNFTVKSTVDSPHDCDSSNDRKTVYIQTVESDHGFLIASDPPPFFITFQVIIIYGFIFFVLGTLYKNRKSNRRYNKNNLAFRENIPIMTDANSHSEPTPSVNDTNQEDAGNGGGGEGELKFYERPETWWGVEDFQNTDLDEQDPERSDAVEVMREGGGNGGNDHDVHNEGGDDPNVYIN